MKKIGIVIPYYGSFPNYFGLFLKSCQYNPTIDWLIFTDIKSNYIFPENVKRIEMSFEKLKEMFQSKFDFTIALNSPYKLCDYKVMTGYLFSEYLKEYDYWGYSDIDMLFGDIRKFLPDDKIELYDKIGHLGHLTLYKNTFEINTLFMKEIYGVLRYKEVLTSNAHFSFTEWFQININDIFVDQNKTIWFTNEYFDVEAYQEPFRRIYLDVKYEDIKSRRWILEKKNSYASWEDGKVYQWIKKSGKWVKKEYMYVHFQKRKMKVSCNTSNNKFLCVPNEFIEFNKFIPSKYQWRSFLMRIFNKKSLKQKFRINKYKLIEKTAPLRHKFRK